MPVCVCVYEDDVLFGLLYDEMILCSNTDGDDDDDQVDFCTNLFFLGFMPYFQILIIVFDESATYIHFLYDFSG